MANNTELAYLAGFFDGEGNIRIAKNSKNPRSGFHVRISATQVNPAPLQLFQSCFGGYLYERPANRKHGNDSYNRQPIWDWILTGPRAVDALGMLVSYLVVKKDAAKTAIAFQDCVRDRNGSRKALTDVELAERRYYFDALTVRTNHQNVGGVQLGR